MTKKAKSRLTKALLETAQDMRRVGVLGEPAYAKIAKRHLGEQVSPGLSHCLPTRSRRCASAQG
jgi:hypothetical protein